MKLKTKPSLIIICATFIIIVSFLISLTKGKTINNTENTNDCVKAGCSDQLCIEKTKDNPITTCEWEEKYKCYKLAICEKQKNGKCGFTQNSEFQQCLKNNF
jgi:eight-cysteine-cluster-containing protein